MGIVVLMKELDDLKIRSQSRLKVEILTGGRRSFVSFFLGGGKGRLILHDHFESYLAVICKE